MPCTECQRLHEEFITLIDKHAELRSEGNPRGKQLTQAIELSTTEMAAMRVRLREHQGTHHRV